MVLIDGSNHHWLGTDRPRSTIVGTIDDATGKVLTLTFRPSEDLHGYASALRDLLERFGMPGVMYGDRTGIAVRNDKHWTREEELEGRQLPPQFGQMLEELGIRYIAAGSPQAKGRIERLWRTLQDRLLKELALHRITVVADAEAFLPGFIERFNKRFACAPRGAKPSWQKPPRDHDRTLACRYRRVVSRDNVVTLPGVTLQLPPGAYRRSHQGRRVEVRELLDGRLLVLYRGVILLERPAPEGAFTLIPRDARSVARCATHQDLVVQGTRSTTKKRGPKKELDQMARAHRPSQDHRWRKPFTRKLAASQRLKGGDRITAE